MNITSKMEHVCSVDAEILYTSFEWSLTHWFVLVDTYKKGIKSPEFEIMEINECKCVLTLTTARITGNQYETITNLLVEFLGVFLQFHTLQAKVSIVGTNMQKLCAVTSTRTDVSNKSLTLTFDKSFEKEVTQYLVDDTLKLFFELYIVKAFNSSLVRTNTWDSNSDSIARNKLRDIFKSGELGDITFVVEEQSLTAHKVVLASKSDVFRAMFTSEMKEKEDGTVKIDDVDIKVFETFLNYMYTGEVEDIQEIVADLIVVANKYQVITLEKTCETYMMNHINIENAIQYLLTAHQLNVKTLETEAVKFIKRNTQMLADATAFKYLSNYPDLIANIFG